MKLYSKQNKKQELSNIDDWYKLCPPQNKVKHWADYHSAKEMANFWVSPQKQEEFASFLSQSKHEIELEYGVPEMTMVFDKYSSPRKTDLAVFGEINSINTLISIEGKADEPYGVNLFKDEFILSLIENSNNPRSNKLKRCIELYERYNCVPYFLNIKYQLLYWLAGSVDVASDNNTENKIDSIYLISQEFHSSETKVKKNQTNKKDYDNFISLISKSTFNSETDNFIVGPFKNEFTKNINVYFGKYVVCLK